MARILVIDDSKFARRRMQQAFTEAGHEVVEAADGAAGLKAVVEGRPDCIITDLLMPVLDGQGFLRALRTQGSEVPVIIVSADIQATTREECLKLGVSAFLNKPQQMESLLASVDEVLARSESEVATCI